MQMENNNQHDSHEAYLPITIDDLKINVGEDINIKMELFMKKYINNIFENNNALFLYCKYAILIYGNNLIDKDNIDLIKFEIIKGGITNILVKFTNPLNKKDYLIRLYGHKTNEIVNREREKIIVDLLYEKNISKQNFVYFPNGRIEEYVFGYALTNKDIKNIEFQKKIAEKLKIMHDIHLNQDMYKQLQYLENLETHEKSFLWSSIWKYFYLLNNEKKKKNSFTSKNNILNLIDFDYLKLAIQQVQKICNTKNSPIVLCHCDLLSSNIINKNDNTILFIDFEYSCPMERAFDIANHFNEYAGFECNWNYLPSKFEEYNFIKFYLKTNDDNHIYNLIDEIQPFYLASHIYWGLWALLQGIHSLIEFDFVDYAMKRLTAFYSSISDKIKFNI